MRFYWKFWCLAFLIPFFFSACSSHQQKHRASVSECYGNYALAIVVDKSGSVGDSKAIESEKQALSLIIPQLQPAPTYHWLRLTTHH